MPRGADVIESQLETDERTVLEEAAFALILTLIPPVIPVLVAALCFSMRPVMATIGWTFVLGLHAVLLMPFLLIGLVCTHYKVRGLHPSLSATIYGILIGSYLLSALIAWVTVAAGMLMQW